MKATDDVAEQRLLAAERGPQRPCERQALFHIYREQILAVNRQPNELEGTCAGRDADPDVYTR